MLYTPVFGSTTEEEAEKINRFARLHVQTWIHIHSVLSIILCMLGIAIGILLLLQTSWHEQLVLYRQTLTYLRRRDPIFYWKCYRIFFYCWIGMHFAHLATILWAIIGTQMTKARLLVPQIIILVSEIGIYIFGLFILIVVSVTGAKVTWISLIILLSFGFFASTNLILLVTYYRILDERNIALRALLSTKSVHFKEKRTS